MMDEMLVYWYGRAVDPRRIVCGAVDVLPLAVEGQQGADLEVAGGDVDGFGEGAPVVEVADDFPVVVAVIDAEQLAAGFAGAFRHRWILSQGVA